MPLELELLDLSARGCRAHPIGFVLQYGQALRLFPEGCDAFTATVRRADETTVGIEFDRELPHPVFERMRCYAPYPEDNAAAALPDEDARDDAELPAPAPTPPLAHSLSPQPYGSLLANGRDRPRKRMAIP